jgi:hypothetical protein
MDMQSEGKKWTYDILVLDERSSDSMTILIESHPDVLDLSELITPSRVRKKTKFSSTNPPRRGRGGELQTRRGVKKDD